MKVKTIFISLFLYIFSLGLNAKEYVLFSYGSSDYQIVISKDASISEQFAAKELQEWLFKISNAKLPIVNNATKGNCIYIGYNDKVAYLTKQCKPADNDQSFYYGAINNNLYIFGGRNLGSLYGVYSFLENIFGCRWYTSECSFTPKISEWRFSDFSHSESPSFISRDVFYADATNTEWSLRNKNNGRVHRKKFGSNIFLSSEHSYWGCHTFAELLPAEKYYESNPDFFSLRNGKRTKDQLCLTNKKVIKICTNALIEIIRNNPEYLIYSLSQNDNSKPCQCNECQKIVKEEGSESGPLISFVNKVAEEIEKKYPDKYIGTFAYHYSRKPPLSIKPRNNVVIRLCDIECCFSHPLRSCKENISFLDDIEGWGKIAKHLYIWDYVVPFQQYYLPFPNFKVLKENINLFHKYNAIGVMEEGAYNTIGGEFSELRAYVLAKLLWNKDCDVDSIVNDFMKGYYGKSAKYMREYYDQIQNLSKEDTHFTTNSTYKNCPISDEFIKKALKTLSNAEKKAENPNILERVQQQKMVIAYCQCKLHPSKAIKDGSYKLVKEIATKHNLTKFAEYGENKMADVFFQQMETLHR